MVVVPFPLFAIFFAHLADAGHVVFFFATRFEANCVCFMVSSNITKRRNNTKYQSMKPAFALYCSHSIQLLKWFACCIHYHQWWWQSSHNITWNCVYVTNKLSQPFDMEQTYLISLKSHLFLWTSFIKWILKFVLLSPTFFRIWIEYCSRKCF